MRWFVTICLALISCSEEAPRELFSTVGFPLEIEATVSKERVKLLEPFELKLVVRHTYEDKVDFAPTVPPGFSGHVRESRREEGVEVFREYVLTLRAVELGELKIPSYTVKSGADRAVSNEILIQVDSILGEDADLAAIEAPAPLFPPRVKYWPWVLGGVGLLLILLLLVWYLRRPRRVVHATETPLLPHVKALRALARLKGVPRQTEAEVEAFYVEVSQVLRVYLEERFGLHAPERTTEEFLIEIEQSDLLKLEQRQGLQQFLEQCDLVKFARLIPASQVHDDTFQIAITFVEQTRPDRIPAGGAA